MVFGLAGLKIRWQLYTGTVYANDGNAAYDFELGGSRMPTSGVSRGPTPCLPIKPVFTGRYGLAIYRTNTVTRKGVGEGI